ncbi:response regulator transcription factor [Pedobacter sp. UBA5917]|jgi:DNA-binding response OmpR family regulator|uniref:response regulator transcription factor n=1 Tax=Pedobacter sp. UBA5917 TaxID=1947061 RepID=UPI0025E7A0E6|nr:response regulator [Pedobacter sp. UBA5917]
MGKKISILEDDQGIREIVELIFLQEDYEVTGFATVNDFMSRKSDSLPDLFLLDVMLPDGNGLNVCEMLKTEAETSNIPVLMMSAHADLITMKNQSKADGFISKPFDIDHLISMVKKTI